MKRFLLFLLLLTGLPVRGQSILCDTGETLHAPFTLTAPNVRQGGVSLGSVFTVGATGAALPLALLASDEGQTVCAGASGQALTLEQDGAQLALNTLITSAFDPAENRLQIGTSGEVGAALVIAVENPLFDTAHEYTLEITPQMRASGVPLQLEAYALADESVPTLEILDERGRTARLDGEALRCEGGAGRCTPLLGRTVYTAQNAVAGRPTDAALTLDLGSWPLNSVRFRVSATPHLLIIRVANDAPAAVGALFTDAQGLICDGVPAWTDGVSLRFSGAAAVTLTALGDGLSDPVLAVDGAQPRCNLAHPAALFYSLDLPEALVPVQDTSAQLTLTGDETAYVALRDDASGTLYLVIEGLMIDSDGQMIEITPTDAMGSANDFLTIWVAAADEALDPVVTWVTPDDLPILDGFLQPYTCDNAGVPELCHGLSSNLRGSVITLGEGRRLPLSSEDAVLTIPVFPQAVGGALRLHLTGANDTRGAVIVAIKLVIGE
ncbi:hypothetical protein VZO05_11150 [Aggregatilineales bacterium SYSU G02658]